MGEAQVHLALGAQTHPGGAAVTAADAHRAVPVDDAYRCGVALAVALRLLRIGVEQRLDPAIDGDVAELQTQCQAAAYGCQLRASACRRINSVPRSKWSLSSRSSRGCRPRVRLSESATSGSRRRATRTGGRQTQDLDLVIQLEPGSIHRAFEALAGLGYRPRVAVTADAFADPRRRAQLIADKGMVVLSFHSERHRETPVDLFATEPFDFDAEHAAALVEEVAPGVQVRIVRLQALLRLKRGAGRPQDLADIAELTQLERGQGNG